MILLFQLAEALSKQTPPHRPVLHQSHLHSWAPLLDPLAKAHSWSLRSAFILTGRDKNVF